MTLKLKKCCDLQQLPALPEGLKHLYLEGCERLSVVSSSNTATSAVGMHDYAMNHSHTLCRWALHVSSAVYSKIASDLKSRRYTALSRFWQRCVTVGIALPMLPAAFRSCSLKHWTSHNRHA